MRTIPIILLFTALLTTVFADELIRAKRNYYGYDYGYGVDGDFWYAGRILGIILGISMLLLCCCIPCVCLAGIWFLGWFGLRQRRQRKAAATGGGGFGSQTQASPVTAMSPTTPKSEAISHPIRIEDSPPLRHFADTSNVIYTAEDRYYTSSVSGGDRRPDQYRASRF
ncbi:hypothetical protein GCK32_020185 [Trichostrongylus colubriformis]|uniref:Uncharacterized protein n=1 Tax=Trichostrongylus colubriformis TaxID=6319 RepID=A0AAN8ILH8_TRICO